MQKTKELVAGGTYLFQGRSSANSCFVETLSDVKLFMTIAEIYLKDYVKIHEHFISHHGWNMIVRLRSEKFIQQAYEKKRERSGLKAKSLTSWKIVSEQVKLWMSNFVRATNFRKGRTGSLIDFYTHRIYLMKIL